VKNKIIQGDCLEVMKTIPGKSIDMILCDLPYGTTNCAWDTVIPFEPLWEQYKRIIKDNGAIVLTASQPFTSALVMSNIKMFKYEWIWNKNSAGNVMVAKYQPLKITENILVFSKQTPKYNPQLEYGFKDRTNEKPNVKTSDLYSGIKSNTFFKTTKNKPAGTKYPKNLINISKQSTECCNSKSVHPTQKPVALFEYLIKTYTNEGDLVLDNCIGSGTTAIACINLNRNWIGIEQDEKYCKIAEERIKNLPTKLF
jgi:site-specific DNA-methyltransferase (adenine-specific)